LVVDSENWPQREQFLPYLQAHTLAMGQKGGVLDERRSQKWTAAVNLQPTIPRSNRLLAKEKATGCGFYFSRKPFCNKRKHKICRIPPCFTDLG
jgi:hypothetical protein